MRTILTILVVLIFSGPALADSAWFRVNQGGVAAAVASDGAAPGVVYRTTMDSATSLILQTWSCTTLTISAVNLTGTDINPVYCTSGVCSTPVEFNATPLADGDFWVVDYFTPALQLTDGTSGDIVEVSCGG